MYIVVLLHTTYYQRLYKVCCTKNGYFLRELFLLFYNLMVLFNSRPSYFLTLICRIVQLECNTPQKIINDLDPISLKLDPYSTSFSLPGLYSKNTAVVG